MQTFRLRSWVRKGLIVSLPFATGCSTRDGTCADKFVPWDGKLADGGTPGSPVLTLPECVDLCGAACTVVDAGLLSCATSCVGGRAPPGLVSIAQFDGSPGSWISRMAELEAAAVAAFAHLADELVAHGMADFAAYALRAANDEIRHADDMTRLALGLGRCPRKPHYRHTEVRSLGEVAVDNAGEGCGRELFGAALNRHQAATAFDSNVRAAMERIATDEEQHASFSIELGRALMPRLTLAERRLAREAQESALASLGSGEAPEATRNALGLMDESQLAATTSWLLLNARI